MNITCNHPGCPVTFSASQGRGRPARYCLGHRSAKFAKERARKHPEVLRSHLSPCPACQREKRICDAHRQVAKDRIEVEKILTQPMRLNYRRNPRMIEETQILGDLLGVFGAVNVYRRGHRLTRLADE